MNHKRLIRFLSRSYLETSFSAAFLALAHLKFTGQELSWIYPLFIFCGTMSVYNLLKVVSMFREIQKSANWRTVPYLSFVPYHISLSTLAGIAAFVLLFFMNFSWNGFLFLSILLFLTLSYRFRWFGTGVNKLALSDIPHLKSLLVASVWTLICCIIPVGGGQQNFAHFIVMFVYFFGLSIPFDIRDIKKDEVTRRTIPQVLGPQKARILSSILVVFVHLYFAYTICDGLVYFTVSALAHVWLINQTSPKNRQPWLYIMLDAAPILLAFSLFMV